MDINDADFSTLLLSQREELMAAQSTQSDLDLAFNLQLQEAMAASLSDLETHRLAADLCQRSHDHSFAQELDQMPDQEWAEFGDDVERPFGKGVESDLPARVRVYFKGMEIVETVKTKEVSFAGMGVAVCDERDGLLLRVSKAVNEVGNGKEVLDAKALIEGLNVVAGMGVKVVDVFFDLRALYYHVTNKWHLKQRKVANLVNQVVRLQSGFNACKFHLVGHSEIKYAFQLARDAVDSQLTKITAPNGQEACNICLEDTEPSQMYAVSECLHRFCVSCMKQHLEVKLLHGVLPSCPEDGCKIRLKVESCSKFLTPKLIEIMSQRMKEESIPVTQKIYCPYPKCSALMSLNEARRPILETSSSKQPVLDTSGLRKCIQCSGHFCIKCKVPWHDRMSCYDYRRQNLQNHAEESKLKALARKNLWRQCVKCNHMIELAEGCFHMTCRCGYEFCYTCGAEWKDKKATCTCPLFQYDTDNDSDEYDEPDVEYNEYDEHDEYDVHYGEYHLDVYM